MSINFIPNDPLAVNILAMRQQSARPDRPANRAGFNFLNAVGEDVFQPGTSEFLFWQCHESVLLAVDVWESLNGPLKAWARTPKLDVLQNADDDLNAGYSGRSLEFFSHTTGSK